MPIFLVLSPLDSLARQSQTMAEEMGATGSPPRPLEELSESSNEEIAVLRPGRGAIRVGAIGQRREPIPTASCIKQVTVPRSDAASWASSVNPNDIQPPSSICLDGRMEPSSSLVEIANHQVGSHSSNTLSHPEQETLVSELMSAKVAHPPQRATWRSSCIGFEYVSYAKTSDSKMDDSGHSGAPSYIYSRFILPGRTCE